MILRLFDPAAGDGDRLAGFTCSTGQPFEDEVEVWIQTRESAWLNDIPRTTFQRRALALFEDGDDLVAVVAWQDIVRVDIEGIWLEVLAVQTSHQHSGRGRQVYDLTVRPGRHDRAGLGPHRQPGPPKQPPEPAPAHRGRLESRVAV